MMNVIIPFLTRNILTWYLDVRTFENSVFTDHLALFGPPI